MVNLFPFSGICIYESGFIIKERRQKMEQKKTFEEMLETCRIPIERYINYRMPSSFDADDVIQETYISALKHFSDLRDQSMFKPWLLAIAKNKCAMWYRKRSCSETLPLEAAADTPAYGSSPASDTVRAVLGEMPENYARLLRMTMDGFSQKQIAEAEHIPLGTVKSRIYRAKKLFRTACPPEIIDTYERGRNYMEKFTHPFEMPELRITEKDTPFFEVRFEEEAFIIPRLGNVNAEATYRYPELKLTLVSTCRVQKEARIHGVSGVKICRDTYNVRSDRLYRNEGVWFTQLTDEYIRNLASLNFDSEDDDGYPTEIYTFLEEDYDICVNGNDRVHGKPILVKENPPIITEDGIYADIPNILYTMGVHEVSLGARIFECIKLLHPQPGSGIVTENYVDRNGRLVLMRWYECEESIDGNDNYPPERKKQLKAGIRLRINGTDCILVEERIGEYAL